MALPQIPTTRARLEQALQQLTGRDNPTQDLGRVLSTGAARARDGATAARRSARQFGHATGFPGAMALCVVLFGTVASQVFTDLLTSPAAKALALAGSGVGAVVCYQHWNRQYRHATAAAVYGTSGSAQLPQRRGLVLVCGLDTGSPLSAAATLLPNLTALEYVALVGTPQTAELGVSAAVRTRLLPAAGHALPGAHVRVWEFGNAVSISDAEEATSEALRWLLGRGLRPEEIVVDISAGRRPMTYGAKDAADEHRVECQYLAEEWDTVNNAPIAGTRHFKVVKSYQAP